MTLSTQTSKLAYAGNGATREFPLSFPFQREQDISVLLSEAGPETPSLGTPLIVDTPLILGTHYQLSGAGSASGGVLTLNNAPAQGQTVVVWRDPAIVQEMDYVENSAFPAESHEAALDLLTMICQALNEKLGRAVLYPVSTPAAEIKDSASFLGTCESASQAAQAQAAQATLSAQVAQAHKEQAAQLAASALASVGGLRVSATDAAPGSLSVKLAAGDGLAETLLNPGADESLRLSLALAEHSGLETIGGLLRAALAAGGGLLRTASGLSVDVGGGAAQIPTNATLRPAMVAGRVFNHALMGGM